MMAEMSGMGFDQTGAQNPFEILQAQQMNQFQQSQNQQGKQPPK